MVLARGVASPVLGGLKPPQNILKPPLNFWEYEFNKYHIFRVIRRYRTSDTFHFGTENLIFVVVDLLGKWVFLCMAVVVV